MAYQAGTATSQQDFMTKLKDFATANGWTLDNFDTTNRRLALSKGTIFVQFRWDNTDAISMYHSLSYNGSTPGNNPDDSGNGQTGVDPLTTQRRINRIGNGPYTNHYFFTQTVSGSDVFHAVLEYSPGLFRHLSFGKLVKNGTWTGGEYAGAHFWAAASTGLNNTSHYMVVDWIHNQDVSLACTVHMEGLPGQTAGTKWGVVANLTTGLGTDRAGNARLPCVGGVREGFLQHALGWVRANPNNGFVPIFPLHVYRRRILTPEQWLLLGTVPDVRFVNINFINPGDEFTVGTDTWKCFPWVKKTTTTNADESGNQGFAYRKVV